VTVPLSPNLKGALYMTLSMAGFTLNDACLKLVAESVPLFPIVSLRGAAAALMLAVAVQMTTGLSFALPRRDQPLVLGRTVAEVAAMVAFLLALTNMAIANATAILSALPLMVTMGAALVFGDPVGWRRWTAILVGFVGVMLIVQPGTDGFNEYALLALLAVVIITARDLLTRSFSPAVPSMTVAVLTAGGVAVFGGVVSLFTPWAAMGIFEIALTLLASVFIIAGYVFDAAWRCRRGGAVPLHVACVRAGPGAGRVR